MNIKKLYFKNKKKSVQIKGIIRYNMEMWNRAQYKIQQTEGYY